MNPKLLRKLANEDVERSSGGSSGEIAESGTKRWKKKIVGRFEKHKDHRDMHKDIKDIHREIRETCIEFITERFENRQTRKRDVNSVNGVGRCLVNGVVWLFVKIVADATTKVRTST